MEGCGNVMQRFNSQKEGWYQCGVGSLRFSAVQIHLHWGGSWVGSSTVAAFQSGSSSKSNSRASRPHLAPQGKPPSPCIAVASSPAIGSGNHRCSY